MRTSLLDLLAYYEGNFEEDGTGFLFRLNGTGPAYTVSADERKSYLEETKRGIRLGFFWLACFMFAGVLASTFYSVAIDGHVDSLSIFVATSLSVLGGMVVWSRVMGRPNARMQDKLLGRVPIKPALDGDEVRKQHLSRISYGQLVVVPLISLIFLIQDDIDPFSGWGRLLWLLPISFTLVAAIQAYRKWRYT